MNKETVQDLVSSKLQDITYFQDANILIGKYSYNDSIVGIYFVDYDENEVNSDLKDYQEKYISSEYYKSPGHLQWNYYLIFLRDEYQEEIKLQIEKDDIYTRKFVFTPDELSKYFDYQKSDKSVDADIINVWKEKLKEVDLDEVYSEAPYTQAIPRYLTKEVIKDIEAEQQSIASDQNLTIKKISHVKLKKSYRTYPAQKDFALGRVNLMKGVNGSGKTSFLEAIELVVAGKSNRDPSYLEENNCIEVIYNDNSALTDSYTPGNNAKYRERDISWYSSGYKTGNELYRAFNRYNFYDSDAAYNLSYKSDINSLSKYLSSIALGPEFNRIQNRLKGFNERLSKEYYSRKRIIEDEKSRVKTAKQTLESIQSYSNPQEYFNSFTNYAKEINWNKELPKKFEDSYSAFEENFQTTQSYINSLNQLLINVKFRDLQSWNEELSKIEKALDGCNNIKIQIEKINKTIKDNSEFLHNADRKFKILESAKKFFADQSSFSLWELDEKINLLSIEIKKETRVIEHAQKISDQKFLQNNVTFEVYKSEQLNKQRNLKNKQKQLRIQIENLKDNLDKLQRVVAEIKSYGKQYIVLNANADACPLCEAAYSYNELSSRISQIAQNIKESVAINELNNQLITIDGELLKLGVIIKNVELVEMSIGNILSETDYLQLSLLEIGNIIESITNKLKANNSEYSQLLQLKQELSDKGFYEKDFNVIKENIESNFQDIKFNYLDKSRFEEYYNKIKKEVSDLISTLKGEKEVLLELENTQRKIILEVAPSINYLEYDRELNYRIGLLKKGISFFVKLKEFLTYKDNEDISDVSQKIDKLFKLHEDIKKSVSDQKEQQLANQIIVDANKKIKKLEPEIDRLDKGLKVINDILENHNESKVLGNFIESNEKEIQEIFQNIHSPKEFSNIVFSSQTNTILLKRRIDNIEVPIYKISTGQRSALALSIFVALNKKLKKGPYLMLFDDPVTYTDDLNILSFLDYLRELVIHEDRQLIFATANQKLSGLVEKKFAFLGETDFKVFPFER